MKYITWFFFSHTKSSKNVHILHLERTPIWVLDFHPKFILCVWIRKIYDWKSGVAHLSGSTYTSKCSNNQCGDLFLIKCK